MNLQNLRSRWVFFVGCIITTASNYPSEQITLSIEAKESAPLALYLITLGDHEALPELAQTISKDLRFSGQCTVTVAHQESPILNKKEITSYGEKGYPLIIFLSGNKGSSCVEFRLYDALQATMIKGKKYVMQTGTVRGHGHELADMLWTDLMGTKSCFATKIAYCKKVAVRGKQDRVEVVIADYDGTHPQTIVATPTQHMAPRWNKDKNNPLLFYSEGTKSNIRLMYISMEGKRRLASNFDGMNMLPTFSDDGNRVVYCASRGHGHSHLYLYEAGVLKKLTQADGNSMSPSLSGDGKTLFYCSDAFTGTPQIYQYDFSTGVSTPITKEGQNFCPSYHQSSRLLAYTKLVDGQTQIYLYDQHTGQHRQLTHDKSNKDECYWSACGTYLICSVEEGSGSRIMLLHVPTLKRHYLTRADEYCFYPSCSTWYRHFPVYMGS